VSGANYNVKVTPVGNEGVITTNAHLRPATGAESSA
jgi:hypothetical protein